MKSSTSIAALAKALAKAQKEMPPFAKDSKAEAGKYSYAYASLPAVRDAVVPVLNQNGLALVQMPGTGQRGPTLTTVIIHESGEWLETDPLEIPAQAGAQGWGSALTYARRYSLQAVAGVVADEDDDAQAAQPPRQAQAKREQAPAPPTQHQRRLPAQRPAVAPPGRPYDQDHGDTDKIDRAMADYAVFLANSRGYSSAAILRKWRVKRLSEATVGQYRSLVEWLLSRPTTPQDRPQAAGAK